MDIDEAKKYLIDQIAQGSNTRILSDLDTHFATVGTEIHYLTGLICLKQNAGSYRFANVDETIKFVAAEQARGTGAETI